MELKCSKECRKQLDTALKEIIGASGAVRYLIPRIEVEIADIESSTYAEDVEDAVRGFLNIDRSKNSRDYTEETGRRMCFWKRHGP